MAQCYDNLGAHWHKVKWAYIKTHDSELRGQEETACMRVFWPTRPEDARIELFTRMAALKLENAVTQPL